MGHGDISGLRVSIGHSTDEADVGTFAAALKTIVERHERRMKAA
jgi:cysteine desulfurase